MSLDILFEDDQLIALNKPADLVVHPARGNQHGTLANGLAYYSESLSSVNGRFRPGIVHRLDKDTTGVMVVAKTDRAHAGLAAQFEQRKVKKEYLAVVDGVVELDSDWIEQPVGRHPTVRERYAVRPGDGREARTFYQVARRYQAQTLLHLFPQTGRSHQLRVHLAHLGHPITGDRIYGGRALLDRQALHARRLTLGHPTTEQEMTFTADPPADLQALIETLGAAG